MSCAPVSYYGGHTWPWQCSGQLSWSKSFQALLSDRDDAFFWSLRAVSDYNKDYWISVIDNINEELNRIRINETPLRPTIFARSSYPTP